MKYLYIAVIFLLFAWMAAPDPRPTPSLERVIRLARETGVPNTVTGVLLRNRLYDTIFEVIVFTVAVLGVTHYLSREPPEESVHHFSDDTVVILARFAAIIAGMVALELSIRGHLGPGGGFAAGVAGGTAAGLVAVTAAPDRLHRVHKRWHVDLWEKASVLVFILLAAAVFHDLGKAWELGGDVSPDYTDRGRLIGHITIGLEVLAPFLNKAKSLDPDLVLHLKHIIISHHGELEFGSPRRPKTREAFILHYADNLDAK
ncbi:MAG: MnhB domain-containing protein, partial [Desulfococcaceae bacterium]